MQDGRGFERWLAKRQTAPQTTDDRVYAQYLDQALGLSAQREAGRTHSGVPGGPDPSEGISDDRLYARFRSELDGSAARRRAEDQARQERRDRQEEHRRHAREMGFPTRAQYQDGA